MTSGKKIRAAAFVAVIILVAYIVLTRFVFAANLGYFAGDIFADVDIPTRETYLAAFAEPGVNWEIAYWSAMISEFTYEKKSYPLQNFALATLGFSTARKYSTFEHEGRRVSDIMVDVGVKEIFAEDGGFTLAVIAFRGTVPLALNSPATGENMRRNIDFPSKPWRETGATVHRGFYAQHSDFLSYILPEIYALFDFGDAKFWLTGHSMGGALAELFTLQLIESGVRPENIITYGFATPVVGGRRLQEYAKLIGAAERIYRFVHRQDMIAYVGYGIILGRSLAAGDNDIRFGNRGIFGRSHHSLPRIYLPFVISQNSNANQRRQFELSLVVEDILQIRNKCQKRRKKAVCKFSARL